MSKITRDPRPGDVGYFTSNAHHCIVASVNGDQIETLDAAIEVEVTSLAGDTLLARIVDMVSEAEAHESGTQRFMQRSSAASSRSSWRSSLRDDARGVVQQLAVLGIQTTIMLSGDNVRVARSIATAAGIQEIRAPLLPEGKVEAIRTLAAAGGVAMVGDGVNDAPALAAASVGIAMGAPRPTRPCCCCATARRRGPPRMANRRRAGAYACTIAPAPPPAVRDDSSGVRSHNIPWIAARLARSCLPGGSR